MNRSEQQTIAEYQSAVTTYQSVLTLGVQIIGALLLSLVTMLGFTIAGQNYFLLFIMALFVAIALGAMIRGEQGTRIILSRIVAIELLDFKISDGIGSQWGYRLYGRGGCGKMHEVIRSSNGFERAEKIIQLVRPSGSFTLTINLLILLLFLVLAAAFIFNWNV